MLLDLIIIAAILIFGGLGYQRGLIKSAVLLIKSSFSVVMAIILARPIAAFLNNSMGLANTCATAFKTTEANGGLTLIAFVALALFLGLRIILHYINKLSTKARENVIARRADSWLGFLFGTLHFCFIFCIASAVIFIITLVPFLDGIHTWLFKDSTITLWLYELATDLIFQKILGAVASAISL